MIPADPVAAARDAVTLLRTGRAAMALRILESLPDAIEAAKRDAASEGFLEGQRAAHRVMKIYKPKAKTMPATFTRATRLEELRAVVADPAKRSLVLAALKIDDKHLELILVGKSTLSGDRWRKLREALA